MPGAPSLPPIPGRGPDINPPNRFAPLVVEPEGEWLDAEYAETGSVPHPRTQFYEDASESILTPNDSPDVGAAWGLNCYRGCEHGCSYCFARPYHEYLGWRTGLDFETKILVKTRAPQLLREELSKPRWKAEPIMMSGATDCYQPAERRFRLTRGCLEVLAEFRQPVGVITKNFLVTRDLDLLAELARWKAVSVSVTLTTLDPDLARRLEPRAALPAHRLRAIRLLADAGVPVSTLVAPVIPGLTDHELPGILDAAATAGARRASFVSLRLPHSVKDVFLAWLDENEPGKKARVIDRIKSMRGGKLYDATFGERMRGDGIFAEQMRLLFEAGVRRAGLNREDFEVTGAHFRRPGGRQLEIFGGAN
ncbi:MAG TPA: PA0069 family radical SAM protein [Candidatus Didemnitutus sp.]|nr:PA0069 family radical SAM protein [Candidatus Didemnitutus sp.]